MKIEIKCIDADTINRDQWEEIKKAAFQISRSLNLEANAITLRDFHIDVDQPVCN